MNNGYLLLIAFLGGGLGASLRYIITLTIKAPFGTLAVNILGSLIAGLFLSDKLSFFNEALKISNPNTKILIFTGICGGLTTFSSFTVDSYQLINSDQMLNALVYIGLSILLGFLAFYIGYK
jgi:CrcB protein